MKKMLMFVVMALGVAVLFSGCGKIPQAEIEGVYAALDSAKMAGADVYLAEDFAALQDSMQRIMEDVEAQKSKFLASYGVIKEQLARMRELAVASVPRTEARKEEIRQEVSVILEEIAGYQSQSNELVQKAPRGKEGKTALEAIKGDISLIDTSVVEINSLLADEELISARDKAKAVREKAFTINAELNEVIAKYTGSR
ncbi:MAG: hypothetical protein AB7D05_11345 [Mangrovibacterium sp.]